MVKPAQQNLFLIIYIVKMKSIIIIIKPNKVTKNKLLNIVTKLMQSAINS